MKRELNLGLFLIFSLVCMGQAFHPNTKWPYLYENFEEGVIYFSDNKKTSAKLNVHLLGNLLHYVGNDGKVYQSVDNNIIRVDLGNTAYIPVNGKMMEIIKQKNNSLLLRLNEADFEALHSGSGAYGSSLSTSSRVDLSSIELGGLSTPELGKMLMEKGDGQTLSINTKYYFILNDELIEGSRKEVEKLLDNSRKNEWKKFLKRDKINWKEEAKLIEVLNFIDNLISNEPN